MKRITTVLAVLFTILAPLTMAVSLPAAELPKMNPALPRLESRAREITAMLAVAPRGPAAPYTDRAIWEAAAHREVFAAAVKNGEAALKIEAVPFDEAAYREYYRNGNRTNYQNLRSRKYARLHPLVIAECIENKGRFVPAITTLIQTICDDKSWVLPAHDRGGEIVDGKNIYVDLASSATSCELAIACYWLGDKLPTDVRKRVTAEIERRTFTPYEQSLRAEKPQSGMWWMTTTNNWNAVCHAGVVGAMLVSEQPSERRALFIAAAENYMNPFFKGFTPDGYCSEGIGYWNFGFGHFVDLAETIFRETDGKVDLFARPEVNNIALFGSRMEITPGQFAAFADCDIRAQPSNDILGFLSRRLGLGLLSYEKAGLYPAVPVGDLAHTGLYCFPNSASERSPAPESKPLGIRTEFNDAGIFICRPYDLENDLAAVFKGGHNAEHHNHNDVGSFVVARGGSLPLIDPGGEVYTQRTFSGKRYDSTLLNSFGHPVPRINGQLQQAGRQRQGIVLERQNSDEREMYLLDIASAYGLPELRKLTRRFSYDRTKRGEVEVHDTFELLKPGMVESALITFQPFRNETGKNEETILKFVVGDPAKKNAVDVVVSSNVPDALLVFESTLIDEDSPTRQKPTRLGFRFKDPQSTGEIVLTIRPR